MSTSPTPRPGPIVRTTLGLLEGLADGPVLSFRGIRYAQPPVGTRRWQPPVPVAPWPGVRPATDFAPQAPQAVPPALRARPGFAMDEDCLGLNVWTPAADHGRRPVLVFIHGGGMTAGHGAGRVTRGHRLAARDVVVVTLNYRLGALGNLYAPDVLGPGSVNLVLQDIACALAWVRREIGAFGGDPANVTLMGQSSGAVAGACLLTTPRWHHLFDRMILQSGGISQIHPAATARRFADSLLAQLDHRDPDALRALDPDSVIAAQASLHVLTIPPRGGFHPAIDGALLPAHPVEAEAGLRAPVPLLIGTTADEWGFFDAPLPDEAFSEALLNERLHLLGVPDERHEAVLHTYRRTFAETGRAPTERALAAALVADFHFCAPARRMARRHAAAGRPTFAYSFAWPSAGVPPRHGDCLPLIFGTRANPDDDGSEAAAVSRMVQDAWIAFARTGSPATAATGPWPALNGEREATMVLAERAVLAERHRDCELSIWDDIPNRSY